MHKPPLTILLAAPRTADAKLLAQAIDRLESDARAGHTEAVRETLRGLRARHQEPEREGEPRTEAGHAEGHRPGRPLAGRGEPGAADRLAACRSRSSWSGPGAGMAL